MRTRYRFVSLVALIALLVSIAPAMAGAAPLVAVKIAATGPLGASGATVWGQGVVRAAQLAVQDYNSELTSAGLTLSVAQFDDEGESSVALSNVTPIVADSAILGVVGHVNSGCAMAAAPGYSANHLALVTGACTNPALTQMGLNNVFRTCATDAGQATYSGDIAAKNLRLTKAYVVNDNTYYGSLMANGFSRRFKTAGGKVVGSATVSQWQTNFASLVKKIKAKKPSAVYYGGWYEGGGRLAKQLKAAGVKAQFIGPDGLIDPTFVSRASRTKAEGALATTVGLPIDQMPGGAAFQARYLASFPGNSPLLSDAYAYDAAVAVIKAMIAVSSENTAGALQSPGARELVRAKVAQSSFAGVTGSVGFGASGDTKYPAFSAWRVKSGAWKPCANVTIPSVPTGIRALMPIYVSGWIRPAHTSGSKPVTLRFWRKVGSKWVLGKTVAAVVTGSGFEAEYVARVTLRSKGYWRVVASHSDGSHAPMDSPARFFNVK